MLRRNTAKSRKVSKMRKRSSTSWKKRKKIKKLLKRVKMLFFAIITVGLVTAVLYAGAVFNLIKASLISADFGSTGHKIAWRSDRSMNILLLNVDDALKENPEMLNVSILRVNTDVNSFLLTTIPLDSVLESRRGNLMTLEKIYEYGNSQNNGAGIDMVREAVTRSLALPVGRYLLFDNNSREIVSNIFGTVFSDEYEKPNLIRALASIKDIGISAGKSFRTDMGIKEMLELSLFMANSNNGDSFVVAKDVVEDPARFDFLWRQRLVEKTFAEEGLTVMVLNGAGKKGLGAWAMRSLRNSGFFVLDPANASKTYDESFIVGKNLESKSIKAIGESLGIDSIIEKDDTGEYANFAYRADILVILGFDIADNF